MLSGELRGMTSKLPDIGESDPYKLTNRTKDLVDIERGIIEQSIGLQK